MITPEQLRGLKTAIVGAAREGSALARYLAACGAQVTLCDRKNDSDLAQRLAPLAADGVQLALGADPPDELLAQADVLFISPAVPRNAPVVQQARALGLPISSEPRLFTQSCPAPVIGVTGSSGKTTCTALVGEMCRLSGLHAWVGGNIGVPLTERLLERPWPEVAVMELSSFQLEVFNPGYQGAQVDQQRSAASRVISLAGWSPHIALVTNITPNHLDRHAGMAEYAAAKFNILAYQGSDDWLVLNSDDEATASWVDSARGNLLQFSLDSEPEQGASLRGDILVAHWQDRDVEICRAEQVRLRGKHNLANILAASCAALAAGVGTHAISEAARTFSGVPHRLEVVRRRDGVLWINDSIATSPERACAALRSFSEPLVLLAGGRDKHLPWEEWAQLARQRARVVIAFGEAIPIIERALGTDSCQILLKADTLAQAVSLAAGAARDGEVVLLSPGGTSFDAYVDFEARGQHFRELVAAL
ncbi:MAG: UDP-N-acetylmuramoyl-L-alanine--D-glutamate ligase [Anaerolineae bacterium]